MNLTAVSGDSIGYIASSQPLHQEAPLTRTSLTPPPAAPRLAIGTPDFEPDFRIICRGDEYGKETRLGFRQITQGEGAFERFSGVAVELQHCSSDTTHAAVIERAMHDLKTQSITIATVVPPFLTVPTPEQTILFLSPVYGETTSATVLRSIKSRLEGLNRTQAMAGRVDALEPATSPDESHGGPAIIQMIRSERANISGDRLETSIATQRQTNISLGSLYAETHSMVKRLQNQTSLPGWRNFHWVHIQMAGVEALKPMITGANPVDCMDRFRELLGKIELSPRIKAAQIDFLAKELVRSGIELYKDSPAAKRPVAGAAS